MQSDYLGPGCTLLHSGDTSLVNKCLLKLFAEKPVIDPALLHVTHCSRVLRHWTPSPFSAVYFLATEQLFPQPEPILALQTIPGLVLSLAVPPTTVSVDSSSFGSFQVVGLEEHFCRRVIGQDSKAAVSAQKACSREVYSLVLRDVLHLAAPGSIYQAEAIHPWGKRAVNVSLQTFHSSRNSTSERTTWGAEPHL